MITKAGSDDRYAAFRHGAFPRFLLARMMANFATQIVSVAVGWQIYDLTRDPFDLGLVGIIQFLPALLLVLVTGAVVDRFGRRMIMGIACGLEACCALAILAVSWHGLAGPGPIFAILAVFGVARAFFGPASASLIANLVPRQDFANAVAWNSSAWQIASIVGPVAGGLLYGLSAEAAYGSAAAMMAMATGLIFSIPKPAQRSPADKPTLDTLFAGFRYIWGNKVVLGAISLDLFAVLLSGAVALLPVYARDILVLGPWGLGLLRAAPGVGAIMVGIWLTAHPIRDHAGAVMFAFVALFGLFTVLFGLSTIPWLSIAALALLGGADMISVYVRETLIQVWTPDEVRGRLNAVNMVFVGVGAVAVAGAWAFWFPELRKIRHLDGHR